MTDQHQSPDQTQGLSQVPTWAEIMTSAYNHQVEAKNQALPVSIRFDLEKLRISEVLQTKVGGKFLALCVLDSDVDTLANNLKEGLLSTAEEVPGRQRKKTQPTLSHKRVSGSMRSETATETIEVHKH